jgi:hypothetical protein
LLHRTIETTEETMIAETAHRGPVAGHSRTLASILGEPSGFPVNRLTPVHRHVLAYWQEKRGNSRLARRSDIHPAEIIAALPHILIWEIDANGEFRCRLSGTEVDRGLGVPLQGAALGDIPCDCIDHVRHEFDTVRDQAVLCFAERTLGWLGRPYIFYRHLLLPLSDDSGTARQLLSVLTLHPLEIPDDLFVLADAMRSTAH